MSDSQNPDLRHFSPEGTVFLDGAPEHPRGEDSHITLQKLPKILPHRARTWGIKSKRVTYKGTSPWALFAGTYSELREANSEKSPPQDSPWHFPGKDCLQRA